jgi:tetratricopeptide (TPR) repeat protein
MNGVIPLLKFTPSAQDPQVLETITVQREALIGKLVDIALDTEGARHQLLIGPRGIGKTHILSLVASRVRAAAQADSIVLAWLEEDPWSIGSYEKFLAAIVARVAAETSDPDLGEKADELHARRDEGGSAAEQAMRDALGEKRLVLLVENLDEIFRRIGDNGQERFRAFVENWQQVLIVATAPQLFEGVQLHESPFYGFFSITHLEELRLESAAELMRRIAELRGDADLVKFLSTDVAERRLAAIEALAGGHPRIWLLLSGCVSIKAIDELVPLFLEALDDLTPYYQDRLRELSDQQQELVVLLSEAGGALSNRALAERSGIAQNQVAVILRQLTERGYVRRAEVPEEIATGDARMSFWELREPLMRLCLDVKQARGRPLRMVVEFLRAWYGSRLLDELALLPTSAQLAATYAGEAFRTLDGSLSIDDLFKGSPSEVLARAELGLSLAPERSELRMARVAGLVMDGQLAEAREALESLLAEEESNPIRMVLLFQLVIARERLGEEVDDALGSALLKLMEVEPENAAVQGLGAISLTQIGRLEEALAASRNAVALSPGSAPMYASQGIALQRLGRVEEALEAFEKAASLNPENPEFQRALGGVLDDVGHHEEAVNVLTEGLELNPSDPGIHGRMGRALISLGRFEEAVEALSIATERAPAVGIYHERLGVALNLLGRPDDALAALDRAVALDRDHAAAHSNRGVALAGLDRNEEALEAFARALELEPDDPDVGSNIGTVLVRLDRNEEALAALQRAVGLRPDNAHLHFKIASVLYLLDRPEEALSALAPGIELEPDNVANYKFRGELLEELGRFDEAEEAIRRGIELAEDDQDLRFALIAIGFARGDADVGMARLREALAAWSEKREGPAGEPEILCRALWDTMAEGLPVDALIDGIVAAYDEFEAGEELGRGLVDSIRLLAGPDTGVDLADAWAAAWLAARPVADLEIPLELLRAASEWKKDRDRSHLLSLPPEQREILLGLLPSG